MPITPTPPQMDSTNSESVYPSGKSWVSDSGVLVPGAPRNVEPVKRSVEALSLYAQRIAIPAGSLLQFAGLAPPSGWLLCFGQTLNVLDYPTLFAAIGTTFGGTGGPSGTFVIPDLRGRTPVGKDDMGGTPANRVAAATSVGQAAGASTVTLSISNLPSHTHDSLRNADSFQIREGATGTLHSAVWKGTSQTATTSSVGSGVAHNNLQPYITLNYIIKY